MAGPTKYRPSFNRRRRDPLAVITPGAAAGVRAQIDPGDNTVLRMTFTTPLIDAGTLGIFNDTTGATYESVVSGLGTTSFYAKMSDPSNPGDHIICFPAPDQGWDFGPNAIGVESHLIAID